MATGYTYGGLNHLGLYYYHPWSIPIKDMHLQVLGLNCTPSAVSRQYFVFLIHLFSSLPYAGVYRFGDSEESHFIILPFTYGGEESSFSGSNT